MNRLFQISKEADRALGIPNSGSLLWFIGLPKPGILMLVGLRGEVGFGFGLLTGARTSYPVGSVLSMKGLGRSMRFTTQGGAGRAGRKRRLGRLLF